MMGRLSFQAYKGLLNVHDDLVIVVDSKDLFDSLSTCRSATNKSIRADLSLIRHEFETQHISRMIWIPGNINPADAITKPDSPLTQTLQLLMFSGELPIDLESPSIAKVVTFLVSLGSKGIIMNFALCFTSRCTWTLANS